MASARSTTRSTGDGLRSFHTNEAVKTCPISWCEEPHHTDKLMCRAHWFMVPEALRTEVWRAFHQYERRRDSRDRLQALRDAQKRAIEAVESRATAGAARTAS